MVQLDGWKVRWGIMVLALGLLSVTGPHPALHAGGASSSPDVVETVDGSQVRGVIVERLPDGSVVLQDFRGELREFAAEDIVHAGPATDSAPSPVEGTQSAALPDSVELKVTLDRPRLELYRRAGRTSAVGYNFGTGDVQTATLRGNQFICAGSCVTRIAAGQHVLRAQGALSWPYWNVRPSVVELTSDTELVLETQRRTALRTVLLVGGFGAIVGGTALYWSDSALDGGKAEVWGLTTLIAGSAVFLAGLFIPNRATLTTRPLER